MRQHALIMVMLIAAMVCVVSSARAQVKFSASVDRRTVPLDGVVRYQIELEAPQKALPQPQLPEINGFEVYSSGRSQNFQLVNGQVQSSIVYSYVLSPKDKGLFNIGPATVVIDGKTLESERFNIKVTDAVGKQEPQQSDQNAAERASQAGKTERLFITATLDKDTAYVNEPVTYMFRFYRGRQLVSSPEYRRPDFPGFWVEELPPQRRFQSRVDDVTYDVTEIRTSLFPTGGGVKTIDPAQLTAKIRTRNRRSPFEPFGNDLFGFFGGEERQLRTEPVTLTVLPLPERGQPENFSGMVGKFRISASTEVSEVAVGDPITVTVTVSGDGNIKSIGRPTFDTIADFRTFSAGTSESISKEGYKVSGTKTFEEVFVPQRPGNYTLPAFSVTYFDPDREQYRTIATDSIPITITGAAADFTIPSFRLEPEELSDLAADVRFLKTDGSNLRRASDPGLFGWAFWVGHLIPLVGLAGFVGWRRRVLREQSNPAARRRRLAYRSALNKLEGDGPPTTDAVAQTLEQFFADRYNRSPHGLRRSEIRDVLIADGTPKDTSDAFLDLLESCDQRRYAPGSGDGLSAEMATRAKQILSELVENTLRVPSPMSRILTTVSRACGLAALIVMFWSTVGIAQNPEQIFDEAVGAYQRGRFDSAAVGFLGLARAGIDDPRVWYNLGNAHFKAGRIGQALVSYKRGLRLEPRDADLRANFRYVRLFAADKIEESGTFFLEAWWTTFVDQVSLSESRWAAAILMWLAVGLSVWRLWPGIRRPAAWWMVGLAWSCWILATGVAASSYVRDVVRREGAVVAEQTNVRNGPGDSYALQLVAHDGLLGTVERTESGWYLVRFPNGLKGWLHSPISNLFELTPGCSGRGEASDIR